ncbi:hypothetical protein HNR77_003608 [Paenibacillus sp. JGP012]|uniref:hypothetical protein n=1 Tax=Paenibacillus sp. JGP012 TaxID=2735914 RepID=UPI0017EC6711|nr:hypothetical protein [Paenibacillus sp. JGP012]MBB6022511.1 hypothetical protein [Paenibacillus sp. JGP012]
MFVKPFPSTGTIFFWILAGEEGSKRVGSNIGLVPGPPAAKTTKVEKGSIIKIIATIKIFLDTDVENILYHPLTSV